MQMDILRCKTPDLVHKEIWTHLLAYNLDCDYFFRIRASPSSNGAIMTSPR
jgi:hypothetical protein